MNPDQKAAWDAYYDPIIQDFKAKKRTGKELAEWNTSVICTITFG